MNVAAPARRGHRGPRVAPYNPNVDNVWRAAALCTEYDAKLWFPDRGQPAAEAKSICDACPVRAQCLAEALADWRIEGVWGGTSKLDRKRIRGQSRQAAA